MLSRRSHRAQSQPATPKLIATLPNVGLPNGIAPLPHDAGIVLVSDSAYGVIWCVNSCTGAYSVAINNTILAPTALNPVGVDGIRLHGSELYFTNYAAGLFSKVPITSDGAAAGPFVNLATSLTRPDDFFVAADGTAYVVGDNTLWRIIPDGTVDVVAGGPNNLALEGATSAQFGRTREDEGVLYITTNGGLSGAVGGVVHGGQVLAVDVGSLGGSRR